MQFMSSHHPQVTFQPEDDIDTLFNRMDRLELPEGWVAHILTHIGRLPRPSSSSPSRSEPTCREEHGG